ncbi:alpha/beta hydrolase [Ascidiimonas aurantiaca]|uniref:alpha/beta fold hydrolase n=1 Tax=Ascidiimonas aurantiaca TaxID=1685432 RepID=UPI0030EF04D5
MILTHKGVRIFYTDQGKGPVLVLLHGFLENSAMWEPFILHLQSYKRVITIDFPGHGNSENIAGIHTMEIMAGAVISVLNSLNITKAKFAGHSMGGYVALAIAEKYASTVEGILLLNSTAGADHPERKKNRDRAIALAERNIHSYINASIPQLFSTSYKQVNWEGVEYAKKMGFTTSRQGVIAAIKGMKIRPDRNRVAAQLTVPKYMVAGKEDPLLDAQMLRKEAEKNGFEYIILEGGHMSHLEDQAAVFSVFSTFC